MLDCGELMGANAETPDPPKALVGAGLGFAKGEVLDIPEPNAPKPAAGLKPDGVVVKLAKAPVVTAGDELLKGDNDATGVPGCAGAMEDPGIFDSFVGDSCVRVSTLSGFACGLVSGVELAVCVRGVGVGVVGNCDADVLGGGGS